jgi:hypothetical protein
MRVLLSLEIFAVCANFYRFQIAESISKYHLTTKRTKDTKDRKIITFQFSYFVLPSTLLRAFFASSFENTGRRASVSSSRIPRFRHSSMNRWNPD